MSRLIDADRLKALMFKTLEELKKDPYYDGLQTVHMVCAFDTVGKMVDAAPTVDAVKVVRCKDCKYAQFTESEYIFCDINWTNPPLDGFCYYGERKDDEVD